MRLTIRHELRTELAEAAETSVHYLRLTPRRDHGQKVLDWRVRCTGGRLTPWVDGFGNQCHVFWQDRAADELVLVAEGEIETETGTGGSGTQSDISDLMFLRPTDLTRGGKALDAFVEPAARVRAEASAADALNVLLELVHALPVGQPPEDAPRGVDTWLDAIPDAAARTHVFIAAAHRLGVPARFVSGYVWRQRKGRDVLDAHSWAEAMIEDQGWVGFDVEAARSATAAYVRLAIGFDAESAAAIVSSRKTANRSAIAARLVQPAAQQ